MTQTIAQQISAQFNDDGRKFEDADGTDLCEVIDARCTSKDRRHDHLEDSTRYYFADGSSIIVAADCWDLGIAGTDCHCMDGTGHDDRWCVDAQRRVDEAAQ